MATSMPNPISAGVPPPPDVAAQMGHTSPMDQVTGSVASHLMAGGIAPHGALLSQGQAVEKVIQQMGRISPKFAPWGDKIVTLLKTGLAEAAGGAAHGEPGPPPGGPSLRPPTGEGAGSFPG